MAAKPTERLTVCLSPRLIQARQAIADADERTVVQVVRLLISEALPTRKTKK